MKIYRSHAPETIEAVALLERAPRVRSAARRYQTADVQGVARCPRCGFELIARMGERRPELWCRCVARAPLPAA